MLEKRSGNENPLFTENTERLGGRDRSTGWTVEQPARGEPWGDLGGDGGGVQGGDRGSELALGFFYRAQCLIMAWT